LRDSRTAGPEDFSCSGSDSQNGGVTIPRIKKARTADQRPPKPLELYARVSTSDQNNSIQLGELTKYVHRQGWELAGVYRDQNSGLLCEELAFRGFLQPVLVRS